MLPLLLALVLTGDAGLREVSATLGGPLTEVRGEAWPTSRGKPSTAHEIKGPLEAVVRLPSGREFRAMTKSLTVNTTPDATKVRSVYLHFGTAPTWPEIVERSQQPLRDLGIADEERETRKRKLLEKPVPFPNYAVEPCVVVTTTMREKRVEGYYLSLELTLAEPGDHVPQGSPPCPKK